MIKYKCSALLIAFLFSAVSFSQTDKRAIEETLQSKVKDYAAKMYKGEPLAYAELFAEDAIIPEDSIVGVDKIKSMISRWDIPPTEYSIEFYPMVQIDSSYILSYNIRESSGFKAEQVEVWKYYGDELKISMASIIGIPPPNESSGMSKQRFVLSSAILGLLLFGLFVVYNNAIRWRKGKG